MAIVKHEISIEIEEEAILWRYMSLEKYLSILENHALFFCRVDKFVDPFEGSVPHREADYRLTEEKHLAKFHNRQFDEALASKNSQDMSNLHKRITSAVTVNCWHINNNESDAMWQLYLKNNEGVCIQTNKRRLYNAFKNTRQNIGISKVRYINYLTDIWYHPAKFPHRHYNLVVPLIHKRIEFEHENELRLYNWETARENQPDYWQKQKYELGELINIDVNTLIEKVILCPSSNQEFSEKLEKLTSERGFSFKFERSQLNNPPRF